MFLIKALFTHNAHVITSPLLKDDFGGVVIDQGAKLPLWRLFNGLGVIQLRNCFQWCFTKFSHVGKMYRMAGWQSGMMMPYLYFMAMLMFTTFSFLAFVLYV